MTVVTKVEYVPSYTASKPVIASSNLLPISHGLVKCSMNYALRNSPSDYVSEVLRLAPITGTRKYITVDVKYHDLVEGESTCIPGWHCDGVEDPLHSSEPDLYHLFICGPDESRTLFLDQRVTCEYKQGMTMYDIRKCIPDNASTVEIPNETFFSYDRFQFHAGNVATFPYQRLLIRVCESDVIKPMNRVTKY